MKTTELKQTSICFDHHLFLHTQSTLGSGWYSIVTLLKQEEFPACRSYQLYITSWSGVEFCDYFRSLSCDFVWFKIVQVLGLLS